jgi:predicted signal transduction protein with EAL and GGDEF domain
VRARVEQRLATTVSIGVAVSAPSESVTGLLSRADTALYSAKKEGRNCVCLHEGASGRIATVRTAPAQRATDLDDSPVAAGVAEDEVW